jgi:hypothetical protein
MDDTSGRVTRRPEEEETDIRTQEIREEIAQTRIEMSETIEAIQERLTPSHLVAQAGETVRNAATEKVKEMANTAGYAADKVMETSFAQTVRANPIPAAMIGIGAAWLLMKGKSDGGRRRTQDYRRYRTEQDYVPQRDWRVGSTGDVAVGTTGYAAHGADYAGESSRASYAGESYAGESSRTPEFGGDLRGYERGRRQSVSIDRVVRDNPIVVGAAAALVGVAIGMSLPASETENRLMGEARDTVVDRARDLASNAAEKVKDVAGQAADAATQVRGAAERATASVAERDFTPGGANVTASGSAEPGATPRTPRSTTRRTPSNS